VRNSQARTGKREEHVAAKVESLDPALAGPPAYNCALDEFVLWLVRMNYPQPMVMFLLTMLSVDEYQVHTCRS
jgi:hypothetical protein